MIKLCVGVPMCNFAGIAGHEAGAQRVTNGMNRKVAAQRGALASASPPVISGDYVRQSDDGAHARRKKKQ